MALSGTNLLRQAPPLQPIDAVVVGDYIVAISGRSTDPAPNPPMPMNAMVILHRPTLTARVYQSPTNYTRFPRCMTECNGIVYIGSNDSGFVGSPRLYGVDPVTGSVTTYTINGIASSQKGGVFTVDQYVILCRNSTIQWVDTTNDVDWWSSSDSTFMPSESWNGAANFDGRWFTANQNRVREWYPNNPPAGPAGWTLVNEWLAPTPRPWPNNPFGRGYQVGDTITWPGNTLFRFRPSTGQFWTVPATPTPPTALFGSEPAVLNGLLYAVTFAISPPAGYDSVSVMDPETGRWRIEPNTISTPPSSGTTWRLAPPVAADGKLWIANGEPYVWP